MANACCWAFTHLHSEPREEVPLHVVISLIPRRAAVHVTDALVRQNHALGELEFEVLVVGQPQDAGGEGIQQGAC